MEIAVHVWEWEGCEELAFVLVVKGEGLGSVEGADLRNLGSDVGFLHLLFNLAQVVVPGSALLLLSVLGCLLS
jgi:hypothetical protein